MSRRMLIYKLLQSIVINLCNIQEFEVAGNVPQDALILPDRGRREHLILGINVLSCCLFKGHAFMDIIDLVLDEFKRFLPCGLIRNCY